jgi:3-dehydroquinate synthase
MPLAPGPDETEVRVRVDLGPRSYEVRIVSDRAAGLGEFARAALDASWAGRACRRALIVTDGHLASLVEPVRGALEAVGIAAAHQVLPPGEATKSLAHAAILYDRLVALKADRHACVVAVGGGVIGDLAGFVAATYARGIPLLMVPTSLLAQVDSAVGGKVGINHPAAKNSIGAFHQPVGVWVDTATLATLPLRELRCGLAEVVKYGMILDTGFFAFLEQNVAAILAREPGAFRHIVARSCRLKADVVARDEREETGVRAVLNFGHTVGHAVEAVAGFGARFQHGEAVALGMIAECRLAERLGWIVPESTARLVALIERFGLPTAAADLDPDALIAAMSRDKKNQQGRTRFVLPRAIGRVELTDAPTEADVRAVIAPMATAR